MDDPINDALAALDFEEQSRQQSLRAEAWNRYLSRRYVIEAIKTFLSRVKAKNNPGTEKVRVGFRTVGRWQIRWTDRGSRGGFLLTTDGQLSSSGYQFENEMTPYAEAQFFGIDGAGARELERKGPPESAKYKSLDVEYLPQAEEIVRSLASLLRAVAN